VNNAFKEAANGPMKGVLAVCEEPLVSVDFRWVEKQQIEYVSEWGWRCPGSDWKGRA
jgi:glyceraldehyde-3-phosphate dehydrogenase/erythrose-4-phosphate dehydrogenase